MRIRSLTEADQAQMQLLYEAFETEVPEPEGWAPTPFATAWPRMLRPLELGAIYVAEDEDGHLAGYAKTRLDETRAHVDEIYVVPGIRKQGVMRDLLRTCVAEMRAKGAVHVTLEVLAANQLARTVWERLGFETVEYLMITPLDALEARLTATRTGESRGSTHVQTDDELSVERAIAGFVPRLEAPEVSSNGSWIRVADPLLDRDRDAHGRFARELSERLGAVGVALAVEESAVVRFRLYERGLMVDEYLSVPSYYGVLPVADELALAANPTLVSRLTGADRDEVRRVARTAPTVGELPPAEELYEQIARLMGLEG